MKDSNGPSPILLFHGDAAQAALVETALQASEVPRGIVRVGTLAEANEWLQSRQAWVVLLGLAHEEEVSAVEDLVAANPGTATVVLAANDGTDVASRALRAGVQDCLAPSQWTPADFRRCLPLAVERQRIHSDLLAKQKAVDAFSSRASHDLRSPLRRIRQLIEILVEDLDTETDPKRAQYASFLDQDIRRLERLIDDLQRFAQAGNRSPQYTTFPIAQAIQGALDLLADPIARSGADIQIQNTAEVEADRSFLQAIFQDLLANAITYVGDGPPQVSIQTEASEGGWTVRITDRGMGMEERFFEQIFEPFQRLVGQGEFEGSGLGLATCRKLVEAHHGHIHCESSPGQGSTFTFTIPKRES